MPRRITLASSSVLRWIEKFGIHLGALLAVALIAATTAMSYFMSPWLLEPESRPIVYDLSVGYLAAWFFNLLVITIPAHNRRRVVWETLWAQLWRMANNPVDTIHDLAFLARCPEEIPSLEYLRKVCTAANGNDDASRFLASRYWDIHEDWEQVVPYLRDLPADVAALLHRLVRYGALGEPTALGAVDVRVLRALAPLYVGTEEGGWVRHRLTFESEQSVLLAYYEEGERLRAILKKVYRSDSRVPWRTSVMLLPKLNDPRYPYTSFPPEAEDKSWPAS